MERLMKFVLRRRLQPSDVLGQNNRFTNGFDYHALQLTKSLNKIGRDDFRMFFLTDANNLDEEYNHNAGNIFMIKALFQGALMALVIRYCRLLICDFKTGTVIEEKSYPCKIVMVKMNRARLAVFLENEIIIYDINTNSKIHSIILHTPRPCEDLYDMVINSQNCLVAFPAEINGYNGTTKVQLFDALNLTQKLEFHPYDGVSLKVLTFNSSGSQLVTASSTGTTIDVFSTTDGTKLFEFCRGIISRKISCLSVSDCGNYVACSSQSRTIHIFKQEKTPSESSSSNVYGFFTYYLPDIVKRQWEGPPRAHAYIHLPVDDGDDVESVVSVIRYKDKHRVVVTSSTKVRVYPFDAEKGGRLKMQKGWRLDIDEENELTIDELHQAGINLLRDQNSGRPVCLEKLWKLKLED